VLNTNVDGKQKVMYAITAIRGIGRRFSNLVCKKAEVDMRKRCESLSGHDLRHTRSNSSSCSSSSSRSGLLAKAYAGQWS